MAAIGTRWVTMTDRDEPFLEQSTIGKYSGLRSKPINPYQYVPWGTIAMWIAALGTVGVAVFWILT